MIPFEDEARRLVTSILSDLTARGGYDDVWNACGIDAQLDLMADLQKICVRALAEVARTKLDE